MRCFSIGDMNDSAADSFSNSSAEERTNKVHDRRHGESLAGGKCSGSHGGGDRIRRIMEAVREIKDEGNGNDEGDEKESLVQG